MSKEFVVLRNGLTEAQLERLAIFSEELGENIQVFGKIMRFGYSSCNPFDIMKITNRTLLENEVGDILLAIEMMVRAGDLDRELILQRMADKSEKIRHFIKIKENLEYIPDGILNCRNVVDIDYVDNDDERM